MASLFRKSVVLAVIAMLAASACAYGADPYKLDVQIVNKAKLPPKRLADAIYAKAILTENTDLLKESVRLHPTDPTYYYVQGQFDSSVLTEMEEFDGYPWMSEDEVREHQAQQEQNRKEREALLRKALTADPNYLPALYKLAQIRKASLDEKMQALDEVAALDKDNGWAYYLMLQLKFGSIVEGRKVTEESNLDAVSLSDAEWNSIESLLILICDRPVLRVPWERIPSDKDIRVTINGKTVSSKVIHSMLTEQRFRFYAFDRQLARQAAWQARLLNRNGRRQDAIRVLVVANAFAEKIAVSQPYDLLNPLAGSAMKSILRRAEVAVLQNPPDRERLLAIEQERLLWRKNICASRSVLDRSTKYDKRIVIDGKPLLYSDHSIEEEGVKQILTNLGLLPADASLNMEKD